MRPFTVCHILSSIDGRISGDFFKSPKIQPIVKAFNEIRTAYNCSGFIYGSTTTASTYADIKNAQIPISEKKPVSDKLFKSSETFDSYYFDINPDGFDFFESPILNKREFDGTKIVEVLTEATPPSAKENFEKKNIDYFVAGEKDLDPHYILEVVKNVYKIDRIMISGGGILDWTFLKAGLIDELSIVLAPLTDGGTGNASIFDKSQFTKGNETISFERIDASLIEGNGLWLRFKPENIKQ